MTVNEARIIVGMITDRWGPPPDQLSYLVALERVDFHAAVAALDDLAGGPLPAAHVLVDATKPVSVRNWRQIGRDGVAQARAALRAKP